VRQSLAIEIMTAAAGLDQRAPLQPSRGVMAAHVAVRRHVKPLSEDRPLYRDISAIAALMTEGQLLQAVETQVGPIS
jgi:histidine ammonia-lyase